MGHAIGHADGAGVGIRWAVKGAECHLMPRAYVGIVAITALL
ncbi:hypothetical protein SAMN05414139_01976 [Burkholderia sp. D7]|nr:hypothetical protein SAMN05414139_01976 [Burkholderia sp. D7]